MDQKILLDTLRHPKNIDDILESSLYNIKLKLPMISLQKQDPQLISDLHTIASQVYKSEFQSVINKPVALAITELDNIIIKELINYTIRKFTQQPTQQQQLQPQQSIVAEHNTIQLPQKNKIVITTAANKKETYMISVDKIDTNFNVNIDNVSNIKIVSLCMYNEDYIINESNNSLVFREQLDANKELYTEWYVIAIPPGNYTTELLLEELEYQMGNTSGSIYNCLVDCISNKCIISLGNTPTTGHITKLREFNNDSDKNVDINYTNSSLLKVLGFTQKILENKASHFVSEFPIKCIKQNKVNLEIFLNETSLYKTPIILKDNTINYPIDINKTFTNLISIDTIHLDFGGYNHRSYPFALLLEITQIIH